jgi:putative effector of murein hydrolase
MGSPINEKNQMNYLENPLFLLAITFGIYFFSKYIQQKTGWVLLNPILLTIAALILFLRLCNISYETYHSGGQFIEFWLKPAVVTLLLPLWFIAHSVSKLCHLGFIRSLYRGRYFYVSLVINVIGLVVGVLMIFWPQIALFSVGFLIGTYLIILGVDSVVSACSKLGKDW